MREFTDERGDRWIARAIEEDTPRHHGRWVLFFNPAGADSPRLATPEARWQNRASAERTIASMSLFELRRRLGGARRRAGVPALEGVPWISRGINA